LSLFRCALSHIHTHTHMHTYTCTHTHTHKQIYIECVHKHIIQARTQYARAYCTCPLMPPPTRTHAHTHTLSLSHTHKQNKLEHVLTAIDLSTAIVRRIWLNYLFAMGYNLTAVPLAAGDYYTVYSYVHVHDIVTYPPPPCIASQSQGV
jgi:hypothetical protein